MACLLMQRVKVSFLKQTKLPNLQKAAFYPEIKLLFKLHLARLLFWKWPVLLEFNLRQGESFESAQVLTDSLDTSGSGAGASGFLRSNRGQKFNLRLDEHNLTEAHGGEGDEQFDATSIAERGAAQSAVEADHAVKIYGRDGNDTLIGNDDGGILDGGRGRDRIVGGRGRNLLIGGEGEDEFVLTFESSADEIKSDKLYDFSSQEGNRDLLDLQGVLPAEVTAENIHSYVKVTDAGVLC